MRGGEGRGVCVSMNCVLHPPVVFDPYEYHMDLYNELCTASQPSCVGTFLHICHAYKHLYYSIPLSMTLTLAGGVTRSAHSKTCWLCFLPRFAIDQDKI